MRPLQICFALFLSAAFFSAADAVPVGRTLEWKAGGSIVHFDGTLHAARGYGCSDCHPSPFLMKKTSARMKMAEINAGEHCGACHDDGEAFPAKRPENCIRCHTWE
ncbi:MAG: c(7)-type cytochrome triheme domain-containing protein [Nitrospirota bacterium]